MAEVMITFKIMPESPETDLKKIEEKAKEEIISFGGDIGKVETEPVAFGLVALKIIFILDESKGSTESLENKINDIEGVVSVNVVDVRRTLG